MWWANSKRAQLYLGSNLAWCGLPGQTAEVFALSADWRSDVARHVQALGAQTQHWQVWLGGLRCALQVVPAIQGVRTLAEAEAALALAQGGQPQGCKQRMRLLNMNADAQWLVASSDEADMQWLAQGIGQPQLTVHHVRPWWCAPAVQQHQAQTLAGLAQDPEAWTCWRRTSEATWEALTLPNPGDDAARDRTLKRLQLSGLLPTFKLNRPEPGRTTDESGLCISIGAPEVKP